MTTNTPLPPSSAFKRAQRTSIGGRFLGALKRGPYRKFSGSHSPSSLMNKGRAFPALALLVALTVGLLVLLPVGPLQAQEMIDYAENGIEPVAVFTSEDPEGADIVWSLSGTDAGDFTIGGGVLRFEDSPDYENPRGEALGTGNTNIYTVMVGASDGTTTVLSDAVTVTVTNMNEPGRVTLSTLQPQAGKNITATLTDPDGARDTGPITAVTEQTWQWARSATMNGTYEDIDDAEANTYAVTDGDVGMYLQATATYTDRSSTRTGVSNDRTAAGVSANAAQAEPRVTNTAPVFSPTTTTKVVNENTPAGEPVGAPVVATDDDDVLTYTLGGTNAANFDIDAATGQLLTKADLNADGGGIGSHTVMVTATDPYGVASDPPLTVTITVADVAEPPKITGDATVNFGELTVALLLVGTYTATNQDGISTNITWDVSGADKSKFDIDGEGALTFKDAPDFEDPGDVGRNNVYEVTVLASDSVEFLEGEKEVTVTVTNGDDPGKVTLSSGRPTVGVAMTATLADDDGGVSRITWQWSKSNAVEAEYTDIENATSDMYTPVKSTDVAKNDVGMYLRATAMYAGGNPADHPGGIKMAVETASAPVAEAAVVENRAPYFVGADGMPDRGKQQRRVNEDAVSVAQGTNQADDAAAAAAVGSAVMAEDPDPDTTLEYTVDDASDVFTIDSTSGQISVVFANEAEDLDFEDQATYTVTVTATDPGGLSDTTTVTIMVIDKDEAPEQPEVKMGSALTSEYKENGTASVAVFTSEDPEGAALVWSLDGTDASDFTIEGGVLRFKNPPDFEDPKGGDETNTYLVMVGVSDGGTPVLSEAVTVMVTNVEEPGTVTLSNLQPQAGVAIMAVLTDPDIISGTETWQWASSSTRNGTYEDIDGAEANTYAVTDGDVDKYLRATAAYTDTEDSGKTAAMVSGNAAQMKPRAAPNIAPMFSPTTTTKSVYENTPAGEPVGAPVVATDDDDVLTYTLGGTNAANFDIDAATGQLLTKADLNADGGGIGSHTVMVTATDPYGVASDPPLTVTITVADVAEPPKITGDATVNFGELTVALLLVGTYTATNQDGISTNITWDVSGADKSKFDIDGEGALTFKDAPDFEDPGDVGRNNVYEVTVLASDSVEFLEGEKEVTVTVTNGDDPGKVTLSSGRPTVGVAMTATLADDDGGVSRITWQWSKSNAVEAEYTDIENATSDMYTPVKSTDVAKNDVGMYLRATAMYAGGNPADHPGGIKMAVETASAPVAEAAVVENRAPYFVGADGMPDRGKQQRRVNEDAVSVAQGTNQADDAAAAAAVGSAVMAEDPDPDTTLEYTVDDASDVFTIDSTSGQISVVFANEAEDLDFEDQATYTVTVTATDPRGLSDTTTVTIMVIDVDEDPEQPEIIMKVEPGQGLTIAGRSSRSYAEDGTGSVAAYTATGAVGSVTWTLGGDDMDDFNISTSGRLTFMDPPDYEMPMDMGPNNVYMVTVMADDGTSMDEHDVMVTVTDVEEMGEVTLWAGTVALTVPPQVGDTITGAVMDPDGGETGETWQWARSTDMSSWMDIQDATDAPYMVAADDTGYYLRVMATYMDAAGTDMAMEYSMPTMMVGAVVDEPGMVTLWAGNDPLTMAPQVGDTITGLVVDPDGSVTGEMWQWSRSMNMTDWDEITGATDATYMVMAGDEDYYLRVMATYTDAVGTDMAMVHSMPTMMVVGAMAAEMTLLDRYDANNNRQIDRPEVLDAIRDFVFNQTIERDDVVDVIRLFIFSR